MDKNFEAVDISRREFMVGAAAATAGVALVSTGFSLTSPRQAFAAAGDSVAKASMEVGVEYSITANLYVKAELNWVLSMDAYLTNLTTPSLFGSKPTTPVDDNATIILNDSGEYVITISELNNTFGLTSIATLSSDGEARVTDEGQYLWNEGGHEYRIQPLEITLSSQAGGNHVFTATEYANFVASYSDHDWDVTLQVDFDTIK